MVNATTNASNILVSAPYLPDLLCAPAQASDVGRAERKERVSFLKPNRSHLVYGMIVRKDTGAGGGEGKGGHALKDTRKGHCAAVRVGGMRKVRARGRKRAHLDRCLLTTTRRNFEKQ